MFIVGIMVNVTYYLVMLFPSLCVFPSRTLCYSHCGVLTFSYCSVWSVVGALSRVSC